MTRRALYRVFLLVLLLTLSLAGTGHAATDPCRQGASAFSDAKAIAGVRGAIARACPCADYNGLITETKHGRYVRCARGVIRDATDGTPLLGAFTLRTQCKREVLNIYQRAACGYAPARAMCCEAKPTRGKTNARAKKVSRCVDSSTGSVVRHVCYASPFGPDACRFDLNNTCKTLVVQETVDLPSLAEPANTPGSPGVVVTNPKLLSQFGGGSFSLNNARFTRHRLAGPETQPDAILILVPGFEGGAGDFKLLAENTITRAAADSFVLEVWAFDRRTNQLEDLAGLDIAEEFLSPEIALDWLYGGELMLTLHPLLASGPNRRQVFYNAQSDVPFMASWTNLVFSQDIDAVVDSALTLARNENVFLGGHSAGTGFTARYASTDFNLTGVGPAEPGYSKLRGLVLLEGGGGSTGGTPLTADTLDRIEAKFDGGLFGAVRDNAARCVDGTTACTIANEAVDCVGQVPPKCTPPTTAYAISGLLNPRILSAGELTAIQSVLDPDSGETLLLVDQGSPGNNAVAKVPDIGTLSILGPTTAHGGLGSFLDDDGFVADLAAFVSTSIGAAGPIVGGFATWQDITEGPMPGSALPNHGPAPTALPAGIWGQEKEVTRLDRMVETFYVGQTNFTDLYYPSAGPSVTSVTGVCSSGTCTVGNVGASCTTNAQCSQSVNLDSTALSVGRSRRDIENLTQAANIDIPVIAFGASNGLTTVPGSYTPFGSSIGVCTAPSCNGTARVVDAALPNPAFPTFGNVDGGYEVIIAEGFAHVDVTTAEDNVDNPIPAALTAFIERNAQ